MYHPRLVATPTVVALEHRPVLAGDLSPCCDGGPDKLPEPLELFLGEVAIAALGQEPVEEELQVRIDGVPVEADRAVVLGVVGKHEAPLIVG